MHRQCPGTVGERIPSNRVINGMVLESQGCGSVVCFSMWKILEKLKSLCSLDRLYVVSGKNSRRTWRIRQHQDSSEDARQSWHDEGGPASVASAVKDRHASRMRPVSTSTFSRIVVKIWIRGWSRDARDTATAYLLTCSVQYTHSEAEVSSTAVMSMF